MKLIYFSIKCNSILTMFSSINRNMWTQKKNTGNYEIYRWINKENVIRFYTVHILWRMLQIYVNRYLVAYFLANFCFSSASLMWMNFSIVTNSRFVSHLRGQYCINGGKHFGAIWKARQLQLDSWWVGITLCSLHRPQTNSRSKN